MRRTVFASESLSVGAGQMENATDMNAIQSLGSDSFELKHNTPFKGGYITRSKGNPNENIHALQLEMCKDLYMSNNETSYEPKKAERIKKLLKTTFENLISHLNA